MIPQRPDRETIPPSSPNDVRWREILAEPCHHNARIPKLACAKCYERVRVKWQRAFEKAQMPLFGKEIK